MNNILIEGVESANIIRLLGRISQHYFETFHKKNPLVDEKSITYRTLFREYANHQVIGKFVNKLFSLLKEMNRSNAGIIYKRRNSFSSHQQEQSLSGGFDPSELDIYLYNYDSIERTLPHELSHLYDYVVSKNDTFDNKSIYRDPQSKDPDKRATFDEYYNQEMEVRARVMAEVSKYIEQWGVHDIMSDIGLIIKSVPDNLKKKYVSLVYRIADSAKKSGVESIMFVEKAPKVVPTTSEKLQSMFDAAGVSLVKTTSDDGKARYKIGPDILSIISVDESNITYPLLDTFMQFFNKNTSMRFVADGAYLKSLIRKLYGLNEYENNSGYRRSVIDDYGHFKHRALKSDSVIDSDSYVKRAAKNIASKTSSYSYTVLRNLIDRMHIPEHDISFAFNIIAEAIKLTIVDTLKYQKKTDEGTEYMTNPYQGVWVDSRVWEQVKSIVGDFPLFNVVGKDGNKYVVLCGSKSEIPDFMGIIEGISDNNLRKAIEQGYRLLFA